MDISALMALAERCAPDVDARPLIEIVRTASGFEPLSLTIDGRKPIKILATSKSEAIALAMQAKLAKQDVRLGLVGLTFGDLDKTGMAVTEAFEPCSALRAAAQLLENDSEHFAGPKIAPVQGAARAKLSVDAEADSRKERVVAESEPSPKKPWDVFGNASGKSLLVYDAPPR
jgi:type IV secretion system protein VirB1